jgi:signal peptide peptidase SppA
MNTKLNHVAAAVFNRPWFIREDVLRQIGAIVELHMHGERLAPVEIAERLEVAAARNGPRSGAQRSGAIAVIPMYGLIAPRASLMTEMSGGTTVEQIRGAFRSAMGDESVGSILFDVDSPGGSADGIDELAAEIRDARGTKPLVAIADYGIASAAYYVVSGVDEIVASPSSMVGWIGTAMIHTEFSKMDEMAGATTTIIRNPKGKMLVNEYEPLTEPARDELQQAVDDYTAAFHSRVASNRGVSVATVKSDYGGGGGMTAVRAKAAGLVDRVDTFDGTIARLAAGKVKLRASGAQAIAERLGAELVSPGLYRIEGRLVAGEALEDGMDLAAASDETLAVHASEDLDEIALERAIATRRRARVG